MGRGNYEGEDANMPGQRSDVNCAKRLNQIEMPFALWTRVGPKKYVLDGAQILHSKGQLLWERTCPGMPDDTVPLAVQQELSSS